MESVTAARLCSIFVVNACGCSHLIEGLRKEFGEGTDTSVPRWSCDEPAAAICTAENPC